MSDGKGQQNSMHNRMLVREHVRKLAGKDGHTAKVKSIIMNE